MKPPCTGRMRGTLTLDTLNPIESFVYCSLIHQRYWCLPRLWLLDIAPSRPRILQSRHRETGPLRVSTALDLRGLLLTVYFVCGSNTRVSHSKPILKSLSTFSNR